MAVIGVPVRRKRPAPVRGLFLPLAVCGQLRVQSWPKKRGTPTTEYSRGLVEWFSEVSRAGAKVSAYERVVLAEMIAEWKRENTGQRGSAIIRERDWMQRVAMGRMWKIEMPDFSYLWPITVMRDVSDALDILRPMLGSLMVRTSADWRMTDGVGATGPLRIVGGIPQFDGAPVAGLGDRDTAMGGYVD